MATGTIKKPLHGEVAALQNRSEYRAGASIPYSTSSAFNAFSNVAGTTLTVTIPTSKPVASSATVSATFLSAIYLRDADGFEEVPLGNIASTLVSINQTGFLMAISLSSAITSNKNSVLFLSANFRIDLS